MNRTLARLSLLPLLAACAEVDTAPSLDDAEAIAASKVEVCHANSGVHQYTLIDVAESSVESHLAHGDTLYADDQDCDGQADIDWTCDEFSVAELDALLDRVAEEAATYGTFTVRVNLQDLDQTLDDCYWNGNPSSSYTGHHRVQTANLTAFAGNFRTGPFATYTLGAKVIDQDFTITYSGGSQSYDDHVSYYWDDGFWDDRAGDSGSYSNTVVDNTTVGPDLSGCVDSLATWAELRGVDVYEHTGRYICE